MGTPAIELGRLWRELRDLVLPRACGVCEEPLEAGRRASICEGCAAAFERLSIGSATACSGCGTPCGPAEALEPEAVPPRSPLAGPLRCGDCVRRPPIAPSASFGVYEGRLRDAIRRFKFAPEPSLGAVLGALARRASERFPDVDRVVPVPLHPRRLRERGFNQAGFLAREIARRRDVELCVGALRRVISSRPQTSGTRAVRGRNVRRAFALDAEASARVAGLRVLLVDDVRTTGATLDACARTLLSAGAAQVRAVTVAIAVRPRAAWPRAAATEEGR